MADIWLIGSSAVTSDTFGNSNEESSATTLEGQGHTVTRRQSSGVTAAPTTSDCDIVIHMDGTCGTDLAIRGTVTDSAPVIACNTYYYANAYAHTALVSRTSTNGASGDTYEILSTTPGWTDGHVVTDTVLVWPFAVYQEELQTPASGGVAFVETTATGRVTGYLFETGTTNLASTATVTRMVCWNLFADLYRLNADGLQMLDDVIVWAIGAVDAEATPSAVAGTSTVPSPTASVSESRTVSPSAVAGTSTVQSPTVSVREDRTASPAVVSATFAVPAPDISTTGNATATPATVAVTTAVPAPTAAAGVLFANPATVACNVAVPAPSPNVAESRQATPDAVAAAATTPAPTVGTSQQVAAATVGLAAAIQSASISNDHTVAAATIALTLSVLVARGVIESDSIDFATSTEPVLTATSTETGTTAVSQETAAAATSGEAVLAATSRRN